MERTVIIVAAGSGLRFGGKTNKQFLNLADRPVIVHTLNQFLTLTKKPRIILVLSKKGVPIWNNIKKIHFPNEKIEVILGGKTRYDSVKNALQNIPSEGVIAIHDGVRPLISHPLIEKTFQTAEVSGSAVPVIAPSDSIRLKTPNGTKTIDRSKVLMVQTPQCFNTKKIQVAYNIAFDGSLTDDAGIFEASGNKITTVEGDEKNIKITTKKDLIIAQNLVL